jgi:hypothetical protein
VRICRQIEHVVRETDQTTIGTTVGESFVEKVRLCLMWLDTQAPSSVLYICFGSASHYQPTCTGSRTGHGIGKQRPTFPLDSETIRLPPCVRGKASITSQSTTKLQNPNPNSNPSNVTKLLNKKGVTNCTDFVS